MLVAFLTIFLDLLGFGIIIPIQPFFAESFGASPTMVTLLGASYSFMQFLFAPFWGRLSDRVGRRPIVLFSVAISIVGHVIFGLATSLGMLLAARMLAGFGNANLGTAQAIMSDISERNERAKAMGLIGAAFGLGFVLGPAIGGILGQVSPAAPAFAAAALGAVNLVMAYRLLPETLRTATKDAPLFRAPMDFQSLRSACRHMNVAEIFITTLVTIAAFAMMEQIVGLFIAHQWLGSSDTTLPEHVRRATELTSYFLVVVGIVAIVIQGGLIGPLTRRLGEVQIFRIGLVLMVLAMAAVPALIDGSSMSKMLFCAATLAIGKGLYNPSSTSLLSLSSDEDAQGGILGLNQSISSLGRVIGPAMAGPLFEIWPAVPFYVSSGMIAIAALVSLRLRRVSTPAAATTQT